MRKLEAVKLKSLAPDHICHSWIQFQAWTPSPGSSQGPAAQFKAAEVPASIRSKVGAVWA
jgi:hypothetical protein